MMWAFVVTWGISFLVSNMLVGLARTKGFFSRNFKARSVPLVGGFVLMLSVGLGTVVFSGDWRGAAVLLLIGTLGTVDDLLGDAQYRGFAGHFRALGHGVITSGMLKAVLGFIVAGSLAYTGAQSVAGVIRDTFLFALSINFVNLVDLRPGRALKTFLLVAIIPLGLGQHREFSGLLLGAALGCLPHDLGGELMLGDGGANLLGAGLGYLLLDLSSGAKTFGLVVLVALHYVAERYSLSQIIQQNSLLRMIDNLGRREDLRE
ncbi:MAG: hypothetical protein M0Q40_06850 [Limnochordia bacterium]|jgi:UDP-GlcNAc:undecaprenyl-phosphate GlcNAc-1-phosphate transferase|nr:hypothetical protein [Limnochordia bacterium]MDD4518488.1 hypothetical protein [Limnochordia bacterium]